MAELSAIRARAIDSQRSAADPAVSAWVSANAGSGKTRVLTDRVARLLLARVDPARILCLTYTKAAATEMSARLFKRLGEWSTASNEKLQADLKELGDPLPALRMQEARSLFARALETPGGLKIETIHAFCQRVLQRFPLEAGVPPEFTVIDERGSALLLEEARKDLFASLNVGENPQVAEAVVKLLDRWGEFNFRAILEDGIRTRTKIERFLSETGDFSNRVRARLGLAPNESLEVVESDGCFSQEWPSADLVRLASAMQHGTKTDADGAAKINAYVLSNDRIALRLSYRSIFFTDVGTPRKRIATKGVLEADPELQAILDREIKRMQDWENRLRAARIADDSIAALRILREVFDRYERLKRRGGSLDYDDLIERTLRLLDTSANIWVHYKLDEGIDHLLVDEAQDTSPDQWRIVRKLTEEFFATERDASHRHRTVFAVGDQKQSIYSFQGADPRGFKLMRDHFAAAVTESRRPWAPAELQVSFRSVKEVLAAVDAAFAGAAMREALTAEAELVQHAAERISESGYVELAPFVEPNPRADMTKHEDWTLPLDTKTETDPEKQLAKGIADRIGGWIAQGAPLGEAETTARPINPGDILILVRQRGSLYYEMIRALHRAGLPVAGGDRLVLKEQIAFLDLDALGRFCLFPSDDLALAEVLRGPFIGFSEDELHELAVGRVGSLWAAVRTNPGARFRQAHDWLQRAITRARSLRPFEFYQHMLNDPFGNTHPRQVFAERLGVEAEDVIEEFLALALAFERDHPATLQGLLAYVQESSDEIKRDMEEAKGRIRVMTVHGAKGLEAPVVFLIDTCTVPQTPREKWLFEQTAAGVVPLLRVRDAERDETTARIADEDKARQHKEYLRQLYVGMTRARDRLYIVGAKRRAGYTGSWHDALKSALAALPNIRRAAAEGGESLSIGREPQGSAIGAPASTTPIKPPHWVKKPAPRESPPLRRTPSALLAEEESSLPPVFALFTSGGDPFLRGRAIHKLLQLLPDVTEGEREQAARRLLSLAPYRALSAQSDEIVRETLQLLEDTAFAPVFGEGSRAEVPISGVLKSPTGRSIFVSGQIDRLLVTSERISIIDFKTNRPAPKTLADVPRAYIAQMAAYATLLARALPGRTIESALLFTAVPRLIALDIGTFDVTAITDKID